MPSLRHAHEALSTALGATEPRALESQTMSEATGLDAADSLAAFAHEFHRPASRIYLCGHSLGLQPKSTADYLAEELDSWAREAVIGHERGARPWIRYHEAMSAPLAALTGAQRSEVVAMNALTVNLHLMLASFFRPAGERNMILMEASAFGSDRYAVVSQLHWHGLSEREHLIEVSPRIDERCLRTQDLIDAIERQGERLALVLLPGVHYLTGQVFDAPAIIAAAHDAGAMIGLDLAHAIGNIELSLHDWNADFAVWCSYKYLNSGPGAIGGCFVHARHAHFQGPRLAGWWGHEPDTRFDMGPDFAPVEGVQGWQVSNPPVFSAAPLLASLNIFARAGLPALRRKSIELTGFLHRSLLQAAPDRLAVITPADPAQRGCQLSVKILRPPLEARRAFERMTELGIIGDWRAPDIVRLAPVPLYNSFAECAAAAATLAQVLSS